jgi:ATP phosphoribosyltransferase regulatory subunit
MTAATQLGFSHLEEQARRLMTVFEASGYELVAPSILQPAGVFLDVIGEALRARTYVFTDPSGAELCLRPDLTVPTCLLYLDRTPAADSVARLAYNGACFRYQPGGVDRTHPREFRQAGIELIGIADHEAAEVEVLRLTIEAVRAAGLARFDLRIGDVGILRALLEAIPMPRRWRADLLHQLWRPDAFRRKLKSLTTAPGTPPVGVPESLLAALDRAQPAQSEDAVARHLASLGFDLQGSRTVAEITARLIDRAEDARAHPLDARFAALIEEYVRVRATPLAALQATATLARTHGIDVSAATDAYALRLRRIAEAGIDIAAAQFSAEFGRDIEYYTGFVFQIEAPELGSGVNIAGGGRYDAMFAALPIGRPVPAIGAAIHTERLLAIVGG